MRVMTLLGTRPEIIRLSRVMALLDEFCDHKIVHTGQNYDYELNQAFFDDLGLRKPDYFLNIAADGAGVARAIGNLISSFDEVLEIDTPEALLVLGDTNSCLGVIPAKRRKIPIFHMEAGNRCFDQRVPEEVNRRIVDSVSDMNLTYSTNARENLLLEGHPPDRVICTGSPMREVLSYYDENIKKSKIIDDLGLVPGSYFVVSAHREENINSKKHFEALVLILEDLASEYGMPIIFSTHPRTRKMLEKHSINFSENVRLMKPMGFFDYVNLQLNSKAVLSDSGTISEEASILNFPALNIRETHERPEAMSEGAVMMSGISSERIFQCLRLLESQPSGDNRLLEMPKDYASENVSHKILRIIYSYTDYVNQTVWKKNL